MNPYPVDALRPLETDAEPSDGVPLTERDALAVVEETAREYARHSHGNIGNVGRYRKREEARDRLLDALAHLDRVRGLS